MIVFVLNYLNIDFRFKLFQILIVTYCYLFLEFFSQVFLEKTLIQDVVHNSTRLVLSSFHYEEVFSSYIVRIYPLFVGLYYIFKEKNFKIKNLVLSFKYFCILFCNIQWRENCDRSPDNFNNINVNFFKTKN